MPGRRGRARIVGKVFGRRSRAAAQAGSRVRIPPRAGSAQVSTSEARPLSGSVSAQVVPLPRRRPWLRAIAVLAVLAAVTAAVVAVVGILGSDDVGGAATPEDAIGEFVNRADAGDLLGVLDLLLPSERDSFRAPLSTIFAEVERAGGVASNTDIRSLDELAVGLQVSPDRAEMLADDVAALSVSGSIASALVVAGRNPIGAERRFVEFPVVSVERDGRWYVSVWFSLAENLRRGSARDLTWGPAGTSTAVGAPTAIDAASAFLGAIERLSASELLAVLDPEEAAVLHRTAPWFMEGAQVAIDQWVNEAGVSLRLSDPKFRAIRRGTAAIVTIEGLQGAVRTNDLDVTVRDGCAIFSSPGRADVRECLSNAEGAREAFSTEVVRLGVPQSVLRVVLLYDDLRLILDGVEENGIAVREVGGRWFVRPSATVLGLLARAASNSDSSDVSRVADDIESLVRVLTGRSATQDPVDPSNPTAPGGDEREVDEYGRYNECFATGDYNDVVACINIGLGQGRFPRSIVSGTFLAPECGWKSLRFEPTLARLPGYQYVRRATAASTCMQGLVARGLLTSSQIPFELLRPQCLRGKNPSQMSSREAKAYIDCRLGS